MVLSRDNTTRDRLTSTFTVALAVLAGLSRYRHFSIFPFLSPKNVSRNNIPCRKIDRENSLARYAPGRPFQPRLQSQTLNTTLISIKWYGIDPVLFSVWEVAFPPTRTRA